MDWRWYVHRLSVMSLPELAHRLQERWRVRRLLKGSAIDWRGVENSRLLSAQQALLPALQWRKTSDERRTRDLLAGRWCYGVWDWTFEPARGALNWHQAPDTGRAWPTLPFSEVSYRAGNPTGEARVSWDPARLQQLLSLARLAIDQPVNAARAIALIEAQVCSFAEHNPPYRGLHYVSAMECGLRVLALLYTVDLLRGHEFSENFRLAVSRILVSHGELIRARLSLHSSAGNHTIAEAAALVHLGALLPELRVAEEWYETGRRLLEHEVPRQILDDGGSIEQAPGYLTQIVHLAVLSAAVAELCGDTLAFGPRIEAAFGQLELLMDYFDEIPPIGDADEGFALGPDLRLRPLSQPAVAGESYPCSSTFATTGFSVARCLRPTAASLYFDHGPLGMAPGFGHAHADALSVLLYLDSVACLLDPGTFTYTGAPESRRYFRGTQAHNTLMLGMADQAEYLTAFQWRRPFVARLLGSHRTSVAQWFAAEHDGYVRSHGLRHVRVLCLATDETLEVWDWLDGTPGEDVRLHWHFGPAWSISANTEDHCRRLQSPGHTLTLATSEGTLLEHRSSAPGLGCSSPRFGALVQCCTLENRISRWPARGVVSRFRWRGKAQQATEQGATESFDLFRRLSPSLGQSLGLPDEMLSFAETRSVLHAP